MRRKRQNTRKYPGSTGIQGLDDILDGGYPEGRPAVIRGVSGTGTGSTLFQGIVGAQDRDRLEKAREDAERAEGRARHEEAEQRRHNLEQQAAAQRKANAAAQEQAV